MRRNKDISALLTDRAFQIILDEWDRYDDPRKNGILNQFSISESEVEQLRQLWFGLNFKKSEQPQAEIELVLQETIWKLAVRKNTLAEKTKIRQFYELYIKIAAILIIPLILYSIYVQISNRRAQILDEKQWITVNSQPGTVTNISLPDGSIVYLNAESSLTYPSQFYGKTRNISLDGEGYFIVAPNKEKPMIVSSGNFDLKVYGTSFDLNSYPSESFVQVTLIEGSISLSSKHGKFDGKDDFFISPGQTVTYYNETKNMVVQNDDPYSLTAWKDGLLVFKNTNFEMVIRQLSRKFNVEIVLKDKSLASIPMDATFHDENINEILRLLSLGINFRYYYGPAQKMPDGTFSKSIIYIEKINTK